MKEWQFMVTIDDSVMAETEDRARSLIEHKLGSLGSVDIEEIWTEDEDDESDIDNEAKV